MGFPGLQRKAGTICRVFNGEELSQTCKASGFIGGVFFAWGTEHEHNCIAWRQSD
ncbi:hypothetical protein BH24CHL1_BH24CHL1_12070 [soil metagenome]